MNDFHQKIMEARVQESNWRWIIRKIGFGIAAAAFLYILLSFTFSSGGTDSKKSDEPTATFVMSSDGDYVAEHKVVGGSYEPSGYYKIICIKGHGHLLDGNERGYMLAADEYIGKEYGNTTYAQSITLHLNKSDLLRARNFHSTKFRLEFHYIGESLE
jgi:hypothetical protein